MKRIILTGATSMMGIALIKECIRNNTAVCAVVRPGSKNLYRIPESELVTAVECDSRQLDTLPGVIAERSFDCFFHFAWDGTAREQRDDALLHEQNIHDALEAAGVAAALECAAFVGAGSQAEYGRVSNHIGPETPADPEYAYGIAKLAAGRLCAQYCKQLGMRFAWGRIFSVYGEYDHDDTLVMYLIRSLLGGDRPELTACEQQWDYLHCADAARAFYLLGQRGDGFYCVGSGIARPLKDYVDEIVRAAGDNVQPKIGARPYADRQVMYLCADTENLKRDTGFSPQVGFAEGITKTVDWFRKENLADGAD